MLLFNFSRVAGMDDVFIGRFVLIWNLTFLLITNSTRYWLGSMHESLEFQILSGIKVSYDNVFYPIFVRLIGLVCGITLLCITGMLHSSHHSSWQSKVTQNILSYISLWKLNVKLILQQKRSRKDTRNTKFTKTLRWISQQRDPLHRHQQYQLELWDHYR